MRPPSSTYFPAVFLTLACFAIPAFSQEGSPSLLVPPSSQAAMQGIASKLAERAKKLGCDSAQCSLLATDFYTSSKSTSRLGLQLSDELAVLLAKALPQANLMNRDALRQFMNRNRIPVELLNEENAQRWLGRQLGATAVLSGELNLKPGSAGAKFRLLDVRPRKKKIESLTAKLPDLTFKQEDLQAIEPYPKLEKVIRNEQGEVIPSAGKEGATIPRCTYMPNPAYTDEAREAKLSGIITMDAVVTRQGTVEVERIVQGLPFGLNEQAIRMMETWRCTPATNDGRAISARVQFEVNFRLY